VATPPALGIGLTYHPPLEPFLESHSDLVDVLEIEPQTLWMPAAGDGKRFTTAAGAMERLAAFPQTKLVHSVGTPVGGSRLGDSRQFPLLRETIARLGSPWCSEHLSFSVAGSRDEPFFASFMLPPRQTQAGVERAATSVKQLSHELGAPFAIETGVSYLRPRPEEMRDGEFVAAVAEAADCGVLLDVHNIWTNEQNGRQSVRSYLADLPLERVWELHLAGGQEHAGYWLDAHSEGIPEAVLSIAAKVLRRTPNVGALIFELMPEHIARLGDDGIRRQAEALHRLWDTRHRRRTNNAAPRVKPALADRTPEPDPTGIDPRSWEDTLGALAIGRDVEGRLAEELEADPGLEIVRDLVSVARAGMLTASLKLTMRLLLLQLGEQRVREIMEAFWKQTAPEPFAGDEGLAFADYLHSRELAPPHLEDVLSFEVAVLRAAISGETTRVHFHADPGELLGALAEGRLPTSTRHEYDLEISGKSVG